MTLRSFVLHFKKKDFKKIDVHTTAANQAPCVESIGASRYHLPPN